MKIDLVSEHASPLAVLGGTDAGGQNVHVASLAAALAERGREITVYTRRDGRALPDAVPLMPGVTVEHVPAGPARPVPKDDLLAYMPGFAAWLADRWCIGPPDVVHAHFWMSGLAAVMAARRCPVPVVQTLHALGSVKRRYQGRADTSPPQRVRLDAVVARHAGAVIATCTDEVKELAAYGARPDRTYVVPCGVDCDRFRPGRPTHRPGGRARVLTMGHLVPRKGIDTVIAAITQIPDADLVVAGGPDRARLDDEPEVARLRKVAAESKVSRQVTFTGRVAHEEVPALMRSADVIGPRSVYDEAKRYAEALTTAYRNSHGVDTGIVRIFNAYGPRMRPDDGRAIPTFIMQAQAGRPQTVAGDGSQTRSVCYVEDTTSGILALACSDFAGPVNIGGPEEMAVLRLAETIRDLVGTVSPIEFTPRPADHPAVRRPDISLAWKRLRWRPTVPLEDGLRRSIAWFSVGSRAARSPMAGDMAGS